VIAPTGFLNVDLEVAAPTRARLASLIDALQGGALFELFCGRIGRAYHAHYETSGCSPHASATIHELASAIEALRGNARRAWRDATVRDFNIGVELERGVRYIELGIDPAATRRVVALGGRIVFTAYQVAAMTTAGGGSARARPSSHQCS
jgi:hypothetical protein